GSGAGHQWRGYRIDAAVHFDYALGVQLVPPAAQGLESGRREVNECLAAVARVDTHDQGQVQQRQCLQENVQWSERVDCQTGLDAVFMDQAQGAVQVNRRFRMHGQYVRAGSRERADVAFRFADHQV